jgi:predicted dinucleotide-binding enzyme
MSEVIVVIGAGQIGQAIARRVRTQPSHHASP